MTNDHNSQSDKTEPGSGPDPLGIIGWVIGGKYKISSYIGGGGFGEVYDGFNVNLVEQRLVVKFFKRVQEREKFSKEAKILCLLDHPNISRVIDYLPEEGALVVAYIDGKDGGQLLKESGALSEERLLRVARSMTSALAYAHKQKIAHRDIKPDNILIDKNEQVYLIDFGIAKVMREDATKTSYQALTPLFAAPERQSGNTNYNPFLSDIYELGVTFFNFGTNEMPYRNPANPNFQEWGGQVSRRFSPQFRRILKKATHPDPSYRYKSVTEIASEVEKLTRVYGGRSLKPYIITSAAAIIIAGGAFFTKDYWLPESGSELTVVETNRKNKEEPKSITFTEVDSVINEGKNLATTDSATATTTEELTSRTESKPVDEKKQPVKDTVKQEEKPVPPPKPRIKVSVNPDYNVTLLINGIEKSINQKYTVKQGQHEISIIQPDYPILAVTENIKVDRNFRYDLSRLFAQTDSIGFTIGAVPFDLPADLEISFNGGRQKYSSVPIVDLKKIIGKWDIQFRFLTSQGRVFKSVRVDSFVTFPYGNGPHFRAKGNHQTIDFGAPKWKDIESITMLVYWSNR